MRKQRIYFEWMGLIWKLTPASLLRWIKDVQAGKDADIGDYGPRHKAKKYPSGLYKGQVSDDGCSGGRIERASPKDIVCLLNMTDWEESDIKLIRKQVEDYLAGKRKYIDSHNCR